ncbi:MAG: hypothetical protein J6Q15_00045, partial [Clostridia bacterium]|nr:hypothetical protein [Clostridia bacterium]
MRMKARTLLLSISLVLACFVFFACKDTKVKVDSISFTEQNISMLVGEEYTPQIKILPSYATDRSYTLISGDVTALSVDGGTITALRAMRGVKLKVVSNENQNVNDIINVDIYAEAADLVTPTNLSFDGNRFSFVGQDDVNASSYMLKIGNSEINIGNNTEYSLVDLVGKIEGLNDQVLTCSVKAVGDGKIFKDSAYSDAISFVKLSSVVNPYIENETLYFDAIKNVASYKVDVLVNGILVQTKSVENSTFSEGKLSLNISDLSDSVNGAEYMLNISANTENYNCDDGISIFGGESTAVNYVVVGAVRNLTMANNVASWDFVNNAEYYNVELYKNGVLVQTYQNIKSNYIYVQYSDAGSYYYQIKAFSNKPNTTSGKTYSNKLEFEILPSPIITANNGEVKWGAVDGAEGYLITIKNSNGNNIVSNKFIIEPQYDVGSFGFGSYSVQVVACGNGNDVLTSKISETANWSILKDLQVSIQDRKLYWVDNDVNSLNTYKLSFNISVDERIELILTNDDLNSKYTYDANNRKYMYDLASYRFTADDYEINLQNLGDGNVFNANPNKISITKLENASIAMLNNQQFIVNGVSRGVTYKVNIYKENDIAYLDPIAELNVNGAYRAVLNSNELSAGNYVAKVFVYGNGANILDADNGDIGTIYPFKKLATPTINVDKDNLKLTIEYLVDAEDYRLYENAANKALAAREYTLNLVAGDYEYKAQAIGNGKDVLNSDITALGNEVIIKKLATPTIDFDKNSLLYTISCVDKEYVDSYGFDVNGTSVSVDVETGIVDASAQILNAGTYVAKVYASPKASSAGYNLIIASEMSQHSSSKLACGCEFEISNGVLMVTPQTQLSGRGYSLAVRIENGSNDIVLTDFVYTNSRFETRLYDNRYNLVNSDLEILLQNPGNYDLYATISQNDASVVSSNETKIAGQLNVLARVSNINKSSQTIEFNTIEGATGYIAIIVLNEIEYYIDITNKYSANGSKNVLNIQDLIELMSFKGVAYLEQAPYTIKFVSISDNLQTIANKGLNTYTFEFLRAPTISVSEREGEGNVKWLTIANDNENARIYNIVIEQDETNYNATWSKSADVNTYVNLDNRSEFKAGPLQVKVNANATSGNYFESKYTQINVIKLDSAGVSVNAGLLTWNNNINAKQYNLVYGQNGVEEVIELYNGVENFSVVGGQCFYDFNALNEGLTSFYLQVDSVVSMGGTFYLNSSNGAITKDIYKLPTLDINIVNGEIYTEIRNSYLFMVDRVQVLVDGQNVNIDITQEQDNIKLQPSIDKLGISINPVLLLKYGSAELLKETIQLKLYSNNETTLNSDVSTKEVYGLLTPTGLDITTSNNRNENGAIDEILEKITWINPEANGSYVSKYEIVINYNNVDYIFYTTDNAFIMPTYCDYDANENGELDYDEDLNEDGILDEGEDVNGNGILDKVEVVFGAGVYKIKVRALTSNCENIANSKFSQEISVTVLATPTNLSAKQGNVIWSSDVSVENYLIKVYLLNYNNDEAKIEKTLITSTQSKVSECDLNNLPPFDKGVYGISVQAMHSNSRILSSKESEILQVIRLPQVTSYFVKDGELYINVHKFFTKAEIYITDQKQVPTTYTYTIDNIDLSDYDDYVANMDNWLQSDILTTYDYGAENQYYIKAKYIGDDATLRSALAEAYSVQIKLFGNTETEGAIISGHTSLAINSGLEDNDEIVNKNQITKLVTPAIAVSEYERGEFLVNIPDGVTYSMSYYKDEEGNALRGVHLYQVNVSVDKVYRIYVAEIIDENLFKSSLAPEESNMEELSVEDLLINENSLQYFTYKGHTFNVISKNAEGYIPFNFNTNKYYYYDFNGVYSNIELENGGSFIANVVFMGDDTQFVKSNVSLNATVKRYNVLNVAVEDGKISWLSQATAQDHPIYLITLINESETYNIALYNPAAHSIEEIVECLDADKEYIYDTISYDVEGMAAGARITYENMAQIVDKARNSVGLGGTFLASIRAHYTNNSATDIILAQGAESKTITILPQAEIKVDNGLLKWNIASVVKSDGVENIYDYKLQVFNETDNLLYSIKLTSADYSVVDGKAIFELPKTLNNNQGTTFDFVQNSNYIFKLTSLGGDSTTYINSVTGDTNIINLLPDLKDVKMQNGILTWTNPTSNNVEVWVSYQLGDATINYVTTETRNRFELPSSFTDTSGTAREFISGYDYKIKIRLLGDDSTLNGFFTSEVLTQRLTTISKDANANMGTIGIATQNGVLYWDEVVVPATIIEYYTQRGESVGAVTYSINYVLADGTEGVIGNIETNQYDFESLPEGTIVVKITAYNDKCYGSFESNSVELFKLSTPTNIVFNEGTTTISWDKVLDNNNNEINDYIVSIRQDGVEDREYYCNSNQWVIKNVLSNSFSIAVKAVSINEAGILINSEYTSYQAMTQPNRVDAETFVFDEELQAFKWKAINDEGEG